MRELLKNSLEPYKNDRVAVLFSGGLDSLSCLFTLLELNNKPTLYTFHLEGNISKDLEVAKRIADYYGLNIKIITIPKDIELLKNDVVYLTQHFNLNRKTNIQCTYPFLYVIPQIEESIIISGLCADDLMGTSKSASIKYKDDYEGFTEYRKKLFNNPLSSAYQPIKKLCEFHNKIFVTPYREEKIVSFFLNKNWREINTPKQKQLTYDSFKQELLETNSYRRNSNLQVNSGIREWHNELISTKLNKNNRKRVDEIYKDLNKEVNQNELKRK